MSTSTVQKVNRKVQGVPQPQAASNPRRQAEEQKDKNECVQNKQTNAREAHRPALFPKRGYHTA